MSGPDRPDAPGSGVPGRPVSLAPLPEHTHDPVARMVRDALHREADMVHPADHLYAIRRRTARTGPSARWLPIGAAAAAAVVIAGVAFSLADHGSDRTSAPAAPPASTATSTVSPSESAGGTVPVYWVGGYRDRYLYREFRRTDTPVQGAQAAVRAAVGLLLAGKPLDPDYTSPWRPARRIDVTVSTGSIAVDLSSDAISATDPGDAATRGLQAMVWTATAAARLSVPVTVTVDGRPATAWGVVKLGEPTKRAAAAEVQAPVWVSSPGQGASVTSPVTVSGIGTAFEATLNYTVKSPTGSVVKQGFTNAGANGTFGPYSFRLDLPPGRYTVTVFAPDMSDGESPQGPQTFPDSKEFTVR